jgi:NACalpha-BTF3-like transcription factor
MNKVRSSRRLEKETKRNVEVMWLLGKLTPDHKTIANFRSENAAAMKGVFRDFTKLCLKLGLYGKELAAIDGSKFKAVNSIDRNLSVTELNERVKHLTVRIDEYMQQLNEADAAEEIADKTISAEDIKAVVDRLGARRKTYESYLGELSANGETQKSLTDSDARLMKDAKGFDVSYNVQISVDSKHKLIAEFGVSNDGNDMKQLNGMAAATAEILEVPTITASADAGYNNPSEIAKCIESGITPQVSGSEGTMCIPCHEHEAETVQSHENGKAVFIKERNVVICPMGNILLPKYYKNSGRAAVYYNYTACNNCTQKCTKVKFRQFAARMKKTEFTKEYNIEGLYIKQIHIKPDPEITTRRKELAEHPFGTLKRAMDAGYLLTKGLKKVTGEFSLAFLAYNLKRVINIIGVKALIEAVN